MADEIGDNQRGISSQIYGEYDRMTMNRRSQMNESQNEVDDDELLDLSLSLGPTSYSSDQISAMPSFFHQAPPSPKLMAYIDSVTSNFMTSTPMSTSLLQLGSKVPPINIFQPSDFASPSNQTPLNVAISSITSAIESNQSTVSQSVRKKNNKKIPPPFPWATDEKGKIQSLEYLESKQITTITGDVQCKYCAKVYKVRYNLKEKFSEIERIFVKSKIAMRQRALQTWQYPKAEKCDLCEREKAVKPVIAVRRSQINWLFLLLGQTLGYCTLVQLKFFCEHSELHRTGAKNRVLYSTYLALCKMLAPNREIFKP